jgi:hypothetical protein
MDADLLAVVLWTRLGADRPPNHDPEVDDRDLEDDQHEDGLPDGDVHVRSLRDHIAGF